MICRARVKRFGMAWRLIYPCDADSSVTVGGDGRFGRSTGPIRNLLGL
jgi:hypothetical protein